jgi:V8-like Glu-specific endopeptidase
VVTRSSFSDLGAETVGCAEGRLAAPMTTVEAPDEPPWTSVFAYSTPAKHTPGTGFLVSARILITTAHCLYSSDGWIAEAIVQINDNEAIGASSFRAMPSWISSQNIEHDIGAIVLDRPLNDRGHFGLCSFEQPFGDATVLHCAGFPLDTSRAFVRPYHACMHGAGSAAIHGPFMKYKFFGGRGTSGSPVWLRTAAGHRLVIAIHQRKGGPSEEAGSYGLCFTDEIVRTIASWIDETK